MKSTDFPKYIAAPSKAIMTLLVLLVGLLVVQAIVIESARALRLAKYRREEIKKEKEQERELTEQQKTLRIIRDSAKQFLPDGTIHLVYRPRTAFAKEERANIQVFDTNLSVLWQGPRNENPYEYLAWYESPDRGRYRFHEYLRDKDLKQTQMITPEFSRFLEIPVGSTDGVEQLWRYSPSRDIFAGYAAGGGRIGYLGSTGVESSRVKAKPFGKFKEFSAWCPQDSHSPVLLWQTARRIYEIDFEKQEVKLVLESPDSDIKFVRLAYWRFPQQPTTEQHIRYRPMLYCHTSDGKHHLIIKNPDRKLTITVPNDWCNLFVALTATSEGIFLRHLDGERIRAGEKFGKIWPRYKRWLKDHEGKELREWIQLHKVDAAGGLYLLNRFEWTGPAPVVGVHKRTVFLRSVASVSSPLYDLIWYPLDKGYLPNWRENEMLAGFVRMISELRPGGSVLNWLLGAAMVGFAFWHGWPRRTSWPRFAFWLVLTGVFNIAGFLSYLALNHTPIIKCPICGKRRGLQSSACVRCGKELPRPEPRDSDLILDSTIHGT